MNITTLLLKVDPRARSTKLRRFALGATWGVGASAGAWVIGVINHADKTGFGITWPIAIFLVLIMGLVPMNSPYKENK
jgi:hypothetical protein